MNKRFEHRTCIVTGAASGIGLAIARLLLGEGATVIATDLAGEGLQTHFGNHPRVHVVVGDVSLADTADAVVAQALEHNLRIDALVNCAGIVLAGPAEQFSDDYWHRNLSVNLSGTFYMARAVGRAMIADSAGGAIVNIASMAGLNGVPENIGYVAAKHGVVGMTRGLSVEWARYGIRVNAVCPGLTDTPIVNDLSQQMPDMVEQRRHRIPLGRLSSPEEQANMVAFLLSDDASYVTGLIAHVDGGGHSIYSGYALPPTPC